MVKITLFPVPSTIPTDGWIVKYRILGSVGAYTELTGLMSYPVEINTTDPGGTLYEGTIRNDCGDLESTETPWQTSCECASTFAPSPDQTFCEKTETIAPTVTNSGFCLAISQNGAYSGFESRIYTPGFTDTTIGSPTGTPVGGNIFARMLGAGQWANPAGSNTIGPMNRAAVWIDSDCNGVRNALASGVQTTIGYVYSNPGGPRTVYVGIGADNMWTLNVNGVNIANCGLPSTPTSGGQTPFKIWHIIPITLVSGANYFNAVATGDGTANDSIGMTIYDNTAVQIRDATADSQLNILFTTQSLRGTTYNIATCPATYSLDTSGGVDNYQCRRTINDICNPAV